MIFRTVAKKTPNVTKMAQILPLINLYKLQLLNPKDLFANRISTHRETSSNGNRPSIATTKNFFMCPFAYMDGDSYETFWNSLE